MVAKKNGLGKLQFKISSSAENYGARFSGDLIPAVVQDHKNKEVLMVAYMNLEALQKSLETGETHFWSRSRKKLWRKGETSGHSQKIRAIFVDCDEDTLLVEVEQTGAACHTGKPSCFFQALTPAGALAPRAAANRSAVILRARTYFNESGPQKTPVLEALYQTILERKRQPSPESYTSSLFEGGIDRILKKVGEEAGEFIISAKNGLKKEIIHEMADLVYHLFVALGHYDIPIQAIEEEFRRRSSQSGLAEKASRGLKKPATSRQAGGEGSGKNKKRS